MAGTRNSRQYWLCAFVSLLTLSACSSVIPESRAQNAPVPQGTPWVQGGDSGDSQGADPVSPPVSAPPVRAAVSGNAIQVGSDETQAIGNMLRLGPDIATLPIYAAKGADALKAFALSCPSLIRREDASGLTRPDDWKQACSAAASWNPADAKNFFASYMETLQVADGTAFATGYFEPQIRGSRTKRPGYDVPVYAKPSDVIEVDLGLFSDELKGKRVRGRVENGKLVQYADRAAIEDGALAGRGLEIGYAADPIEFFFLQIQGSGRLLLPDGGVMRIGYDGQNGREYVGIGRVLRDRDALAPGQASMQGIVQWIRDNPAEGRELMRMNKSFIFFRELTGAGPLGSMGYAVAPRTTVAIDPKFIPMGAPVLLSMEHEVANGIWVAQDTGGAIKGANRFDTFWGAGDEARTIAGGMSSNGRALVFVPKGTFARLSLSASGQ